MSTPIDAMTAPSTMQQEDGVVGAPPSAFVAADGDGNARACTGAEACLEQQREPLRHSRSSNSIAIPSHKDYHLHAEADLELRKVASAVSFRSEEGSPMATSHSIASTIDSPRSASQVEASAPCSVGGDAEVPCKAPESIVRPSHDDLIHSLPADLDPVEEHSEQEAMQAE